MKIQYLGFIPLFIVICIAHWKVITFYRKYKTVNYLSHNVPVGQDPSVWVMIVVLFWLSIVILGIMWAIGLL